MSYARVCPKHGVERVEVHGEGIESGRGRSVCPMCDQEQKTARKPRSGRPRRIPGPSRTPRIYP
jgi:hypothetical protein